MNKIVAIVGPTATGKTDLAVSLCKKFNGEIISVDSRQVYKEMNIGTGKTIISSIPELSATMLRSNVANGSVIQSHLDNLILPSERLNAYDYSLLAQRKIKEILSRKKVPFLVGGTGFYMDVILGRRVLAGVGADLMLREKLESLSRSELIEKLEKLDPVKLKDIDKQNKYRLIRAVEITTGHLQGHPFRQGERGGLMENKYKPLIVGLSGDNSYLYNRADLRTDSMIEAGLVDEVKELVKKYGWEAPGLNALGYRELKPYLEGTVQLNESVKKLKYDTHAYVRRQKTYFKKYFPDACWFEVSQAKFEEEAVNKVNLFLK